MFKLTHKLPRHCWVAVSGGVDSMAALEWLNKSDRVLGILHVNHNTGAFSNKAHEFVKEYARARNIEFRCLELDSEPPKGESKEAWWRDKRYEFFHSFKESVVLGHNFDDCLEEYVMCTMVRGFSGTIGYNNGNCIRPFRLWKRDCIEDYAARKDVKWIEDPSNVEVRFKRNYIRHEIIPKLKELNPGVYNIVRKLVENG